MKDSLLLNKILASVLTALFVMLMIDFFADTFFFADDAHHDLAEGEHFSYNIEVEEAITQTQKVSDEEPVIASILDLLAGADLVAGKKVAKKCTACHTFNKGGVNRIGPNQWDVVARARGTVEGFAYSEAVLASGGAWDYESLNKFLYNPKRYLPGTKMIFTGIKSDQDRANLIFWLRSLSDNPVALP